MSHNGYQPSMCNTSGFNKALPLEVLVNEEDSSVVVGDV